MNFQEQIRYDKLQRFRERLHPGTEYRADATEQGVQDAVNATIEAKPEAKENDPNIVELDSENYGAPPENSGITAYKKGMKSPNASYTEPQAWEDEHGNWFYNFAGAIQLAKALGRTLPNIDQLIVAINANPDNFRQSAGYRRGGSGKFYERGKFSNFWSSTKYGSNSAHYACLKRGGVLLLACSVTTVTAAYLSVLLVAKK